MRDSDRLPPRWDHRRSDADSDIEEESYSFSRTARPPGFQPAPPVEVVETGTSWVARLNESNKDEEARKRAQRHERGRDRGQGQEGSKTSRKRQKTSSTSRK